MLFTGGRILTMNPEQQVVDYLEVLDQRISSLGRADAHRGGIDLSGKTLLPGFIDTHMHLLNYGSVLKAVNLGGCKSIAELLQRIKIRVEKVAPEMLIFGQGWDENLYGGLLPSRADLDKVAPDNPLILSRVCGHLIVVNSKALKTFNISDNIQTPEGGAIDRDKSGQLTGVFREKALDLIFDKIPARSMTEIEELLIAAGSSVLAHGITTIHTDDLAEFDDLLPVVQLYQKLFSRGQIPKTHLHIKSHHLEQAQALGYKTGVKIGGITIGAVKLFADGSLGARTAALSEGYSDLPTEKGILCYSDEELYQLVKEAHQADFAVAIHGIGDAATSQALRIIGQVQTENPKPDLRHRLIHAQILNQEVMAEMYKYGVIAEIQPIFINTDLHWAEKRVGQRIQTSYNWQTLWQKGIRLSGSSDCPVEPVNPLWGIYSAVTRKDLAGCPDQGWYRKEALNLEQALQLFTTCGAYTGYEEAENGMLALHRQADLVVLDRPIDLIDLDEIKDVQVEMTIINGQIVYQKK